MQGIAEAYRCRLNFLDTNLMCIQLFNVSGIASSDNSDDLMNAEFSNEALRETLNSCFYYESLLKFLTTLSGKAIEL